MTGRRVLVSLVTMNEEAFLPHCLDSLKRQDLPLSVRVFDNASRDRTVEIAGAYGVEVYRSDENQGFSRGHNQNLRDGGFDFAVLLNADVVLQHDCLKRLVALLEEYPGVGMCGGKLLRMDRNAAPVHRQGRPVLDSTGIYFTPTQRHFDRGGDETDQGQFENRQSVFGITGALLACRREMLQDVCWEGEVLDEDFFAYREDADLAWRARLRGWEAVYEPRALALHHRRVSPQNRAALSPIINFHSLKNRYLLRMKNFDRAVARRCFPYMWLRDAGILLYVLARERSSLPAYAEVRRLRPRFHEKRADVQGRRRVPPEAMAGWFAFRPVAKDF